MLIEKDIIGRYVITTPDEDTELLLDIHFHFPTKEPILGIYQGHKHQAVNDQLEALEAVNWLTYEEVDELIELLMRCRVEMNSINFRRETK